MADNNSTSVNFKTAYDLTDQLKKSANDIGSIDKAASLGDFVTLKSNGLCDSFPQDFDNAIEKLVENINNSITLCL